MLNRTRMTRILADFLKMLRAAVSKIDRKYCEDIMI